MHKRHTKASSCQSRGGVRWPGPCSNFSSADNSPSSLLQLSRAHPLTPLSPKGQFSGFSPLPLLCPALKCTAHPLPPAVIPCIPAMGSQPSSPHHTPSGTMPGDHEQNCSIIPGCPSGVTANHWIHPMEDTPSAFTFVAVPLSSDVNPWCRGGGHRESVNQCNYRSGEGGG